MAPLLKGLLAAMALPRAAFAAKRSARRAATKAGLYAAAGTLAIIGAGFLVAGLVLYLTDLYGILRALLIVGAGFLVLGLGLIAALKLGHAGAQPHAKASAAFALPPHEVAEAALFEARMTEAAGKYTLPLTLGALAVGVVGGLIRGGKAKHRRQT